MSSQMHVDPDSVLEPKRPDDCTPELKAFCDQRRAMEAKSGIPPCPLLPWQEEMCEDMFLAQRYELKLEQLAEIFHTYAAWKKECNSVSQQSSQEAGQGQVPGISPRGEGPVPRPQGPDVPAAQ